MNLVNYILYFLGEVKNVTIPGLGLFEVKFIPTEKQAEKILPPKYTISFSQQYDLKNDNVIKLIANFENLPLEKTKDLLQKTVLNWKETLKNEDLIILPKLGKLISDKEKILFEMSEDCIFNYKNFGLPSI